MSIENIKKNNLTTKADQIPWNKFARMDKKDALFLSVLIIFYTFTFTVLSYLRMVDFFAQNWDLGINMQMLYSTTHGYLLFETGDFQTLGVHTFLEVHSGYIAYPIAYVYTLFPYATTLFFIQSMVLSLSSIPLLLLTKGFFQKRSVQYLLILLFLFNFITVSSLLYDFHWEAFIPLEFFSFVYYLYAGNYKIAALFVLLGAITIEVIPLLMGGMVFFLLIERFYHRFNRESSLTLSDLSSNTAYLLLVLSAASFTTIEFTQLVLLPHFFPILSSRSAISGPLYSLFKFRIFRGEYLIVVIYWMAVLFSFGYINLIRKKYILIALPWIFFTLLVSPYYGSFFGDQYGFAALAPLFIGILYGVKKALDENKGESVDYQISNPLTTMNVFFFLTPIILAIVYWTHKPNILLSLSPAFIVYDYLLFGLLLILYLTRKANIKKLCTKWIPLRLRNLRHSSIIAPFVILLIINLALSPLNTDNFKASPMPGYTFTYGINPASNYMPALTSYIPYNSTVVASDNLFPFIANDVNAYSFMWYYNSSVSTYFPFSSSHLPEYLLIDQNQMGFIPHYITSKLFLADGYGILAYIQNYNNFPGNIYLMKLHYSGIPMEIGQTR